MGSKGRPKNKFIKDLTYEKSYVIVFIFRTLTYIYCKPNDMYTFVPLEITKTNDVKKLNIQKYPNEVVANSVLKKIPPMDINGYDVYPEVQMFDLI